MCSLGKDVLYHLRQFHFHAESEGWAGQVAQEGRGLKRCTDCRGKYRSQFRSSKLIPGKPALSPRISRQEKREDAGLEGALSSLSVMHQNRHHTKLVTRGPATSLLRHHSPRQVSTQLLSPGEAFEEAAWRGSPVQGEHLLKHSERWHSWREAGSLPGEGCWRETWRKSCGEEKIKKR